MNKLLKAFLGLLIAAAVGAPAVSLAHSRHHREKEMVGYFVEWGIYGRNYRVKNIVDSGSADKLTVINYAFSNVVPDASGQVVCKLADEWADYQVPWSAEQSVTGTEVTWPNPILGNFQQLKALKELYPNIRVLISLGGWTFSKHFSDASLTAASRQAFVKSCVDLFIKGDLPDPGWGGMGGPGAAAGVFDGIDVDWEWPASEGNPGNVVRPEDTQNFTLLLKEFRNQMDAIDRDLLLSIVAPVPESQYSKIQLRKVSQVVDFINMIGYDFYGAWDPTTNLQSNLFEPRQHQFSDFSIHKTVRGYLRAGVPEKKLNVGAPFYSRGWTNVNNANAGLFQAAGGPAPGTFEAGVEDYKVVKNLIGNGFVRYFDHHARAAWLFDGTTFWTLDDPAVMCNKALYVKFAGLGGIMFWELSGDDAEGSLITALDRCMNSRGWW
jgi:chitinase